MLVCDDRLKIYLGASINDRLKIHLKSAVTGCKLPRLAVIVLWNMEGHIVQFTDSVKNGTEVGRKLDFLLQEMNREVNTTGSKASDSLITQAVVDAKCIIEKLREQVQNAV